MAYRTLCTLARGGMGQVDLCVRQTGRFERLYAVKRLHPHLREDETMRSMFLDEARVAGLVRHANVVAVLDVGEDEEGPFLVMDYIEGVSLSRLVRAQAQTEIALPVPVCAQLVAQIARGLHAAHELMGPDGQPLHLVHRDVSPQNILVGRDGTVRVTDFGIAKALGRSTHTSTGVLKGKLGYMSPEQLRFEPVDRRSDLFSLGVVLFELACLRRLFRGDDASEVARQILADVPPDLGEARPDAPPALVELAFELLAKRRDDRPATAHEVADRLDELVTAYGEVVDLAGHVEMLFGDQLREEHERIRTLAEREEQVSEPPVVLGPEIDADAPARVASRRLWWVAAAVVMGGVTAAVAVANSAGETSAQPDPAPALVGAEPLVTLELDSRPSQAQIVVDDAVVGRTPLSWKVPRGETPVVMKVIADGFVEAQHTVVPDRDQSVLLALTPMVIESEPVREPEPEPEPEPRPRATKAKRRHATPAAPTEPATRPQFRKFD